MKYISLVLSFFSVCFSGYVYFSQINVKPSFTVKPSVTFMTQPKQSGEYIILGKPPLIIDRGLLKIKPYEPIDTILLVPFTNGY